MNINERSFMKNASFLLAIVFGLSILYGQTKSSLKIPTLPGQLYWHNSPKVCTMKSGELTIVAGEKTDMFRDPNVGYNTDNAPKLLFKADQNFVLTASISHSFTSKWDAGGLVVIADSLNWIKYCFEKDYTGKRRVVSVVTKNISDDCNSVEIESDIVHYKIAKADNVITLYYSMNGKNWFLVRHLQFDAKNGVSAGFIAQSPTGKNCTVKFNVIKYESKKIKDPYAGE